MITTIADALKQAKSSLEIEGSYISLEQSQLTEKILRGEISEPDYHKKVLEIVKR